MKTIQILGLFAFLTAYPLAYGQGNLGTGIVNASGRFGHEIGSVGANANRMAAQNLYQQGLQDEAQGWATMNVGLLSKSLTEGLSGAQADDQAKHFGQQAMKALQSGGDAGNVLLNKYGTSEDTIRDFANNAAQLAPQANSEFNKYGIQVNHDSSLLQTPFGTFPLSDSIDSHVGDLVKAINSVASEYGVNASDALAGVKAGLATRDSISQKAYDDAKSQAKTNGGVSASTANVASNGTSSGSSSGAADGKGANRGPASANSDLITQASSGKDFDMLQRQMALNRSRDEEMRKLGKLVKFDAVGDKSMNLFAIVHERYQEMRHAGRFNEGPRYTNIAAIPQPR